VIRKFGSTRKFVEIYFLFTSITNLILALQMQSVNGLEEPFEDNGKKILSLWGGKTHCTLIATPNVDNANRRQKKNKS
jgi:hypothetical protein